MIFNVFKAAKDIFFNNSVTGISATNVQDALNQIADYRVRIELPTGTNAQQKYNNARLGLTVYTPVYNCRTYSPTGSDGAFMFLCIKTNERLYGTVLAFNSDNSLVWFYNPAKNEWRQLQII